MDKCPDGGDSIDASDIWPVRAPKVFNQLPATSMFFLQKYTPTPPEVPSKKKKKVQGEEWAHQNMVIPLM